MGGRGFVALVDNHRRLPARAQMVFSGIHRNGEVRIAVRRSHPTAIYAGSGGWFGFRAEIRIVLDEKHQRLPRIRLEPSRRSALSVFTSKLESIAPQPGASRVSAGVFSARTGDASKRTARIAFILATSMVAEQSRHTLDEVLPHREMLLSACERLVRHERSANFSPGSHRPRASEGRRISLAIRRASLITIFCLGFHRSQQRWATARARRKCREENTTHHIALNTWESLGAKPPPAGHPGLYHLATVL